MDIPRLLERDGTSYHRAAGGLLELATYETVLAVAAVISILFLAPVSRACGEVPRSKPVAR